jgi:glutamate/tyrosine decarboxylase-like PLP-dependent enzyme
MTTLDHESLALLAEALKNLDAGFDHLPPFRAEVDPRIAGILDQAARRMRDNFPYQHPLYLGQMLKPPHPVARLAYALAMYINPNNHALDGGRASSQMEKEAVAELAAMFGWQEHLGHLCGGGTMANFEALWVAREATGGRGIAASSQAHYTHARLSEVLGIPFVSIPIDGRGRMDVKALEQLLLLGDVGTVVATLGTTAAGAVDPLADIVDLRDRFGFRLHVDAAYGGYFTLAPNLDDATRAAFDAVVNADSIAIDPHKHGLQPYGCGCVLFRDASVGRYYKHDSPYTYFSSRELHLGEISLECSRAGAAAVALWSTMRLLPPVAGGEFARMLGDCRSAAIELYGFLENESRFVPIFTPELDIVAWAMRAETATESSRAARLFFENASHRDIHLALAKFPRSMCQAASPVEEWDAQELSCIRACVMKPEHLAWMSEITRRLSEVQGGQ